MDALLTAADAPLREWLASDERLDAAWRGFLERAQREQPALSLELEPFSLFMLERLKALKGEAPASALLASLHAGDLLLAEGLLSARPSAVARFQSELRLIATPELAQSLFERVFLGAQGQPPRIRHYQGLGPLQAWLKVVAARLEIDAGRLERREVSLEEGLLGSLAAEPDSELAYLSRRYGQEIKAAFAQAISQLEPHERNLLRFSLAGLTAAQVGRLAGLHRVTVAKQLAATRWKILALTRGILADSLEARESEVESLLRSLHSRVSVSLERLLGETASSDEAD